ncbi:hypothetical protein ACWDTP_20990 [Mycobacterium sp. NPDC003449]
MSIVRICRIPAAVGIFAVLAISVVGCGDRDGSATPAPTASAASAPILNPYTAEHLVKAIADAGLPVPNPREVTERQCQGIGCTADIETDTVSVITFPNTGRAELHAGVTPGAYQIANVVMTFAPSVAPERRGAYRSVLSRLVG